MALNERVLRRLLAAIEADSLVFLCGAGLSVPSGLPPAIWVSQTCYDRWSGVEALNPELRDNIDKLAGHFHRNGMFDKFIIIVPWDELVGTPNNGHAAVADLLICRGAQAALSANFDNLIERWAEERKVSMLGALDGQEAVRFSSNVRPSPLLKFHGCMIRDRNRTLWTTEQLGDHVISDRVESCSDWLKLNLPGKDLVVVGFWTDWGYLNDKLADALTIDTSRSVTVINPSSTDELQRKAPHLWNTLNDLSDSFEHIVASAEETLEELRLAFSSGWVRNYRALWKSLVHTGVKAPSDVETPESLTCNDLYDLRRDVEGLPYNRAALLKKPPANSAQMSLVHHLLADAGAEQRGAWLEYQEQSIRIVNGAGRELNEVRERYREPASVLQSDLVICAGAIDLGVPGNLVGSGQGDSIVRPEPGGLSKWMTSDKAREELGL